MRPQPTYGGRERRRAPRYKVNFPATWEGAAGARPGAITDISALGCFLLTDTERAERGGLIEIDLRLPGGGGIGLRGRVVYVTEEIGFGVEFCGFGREGDRKRLEWLIKAEARRAARASRVSGSCRYPARSSRPEQSYRLTLRE
jgi:hypothetical protein